MGVVTVTWWLQDALSKYQAPPGWFLEYTQICIIQKTHRHLNTCCKTLQTTAMLEMHNAEWQWHDLILPNLSLHVWFKDQMQLRLRPHLKLCHHRDKAWCLQPQNVSWACQDATHGVTEIESLKSSNVYVLTWRCCCFCNNSADRTDVSVHTAT